MERLRPNDPEQIGPWQIVNRLGAGGMGIVYMGTNGTHAAAIKVVRDHLLEDPTSRTRLAREVASLKKVKSKYVAEIVGSDVEGSPAWIATSYVDGPSLRVLLDTEGPLSEKSWHALASGLLQALSAIHKVNIIHRDVKPANILMSTTGPRLIDFGISFSNDSTSLTRTGLVAGTPAWLSPEQFENRVITSAVDNFALGSVLYYAATGIAPWGSDDSSVAQVMRQILTAEPELESLTDIQREVIGGLLEKDPKKRLTADAAMKLLKVSPEVLSDFAPTRRVAANDKKSSNLKNILIGVTAVVVVGVGLVLATHKGGSPKVADSNPATGSQSSVSETQSTSAWSGEFAGDTAPQNGFGSTYKIYVCDQNIDAKSLKIESAGSATVALPTPSVTHNATQCGVGFDTVYVAGTVPKSATTYKLAGKTTSGIAVQYSFEVKPA